MLCRYFSLLVCALDMASCGTTRSGNLWGETATFTPGRDALANAARSAAFDPWTWVPLAGAAVLTIDDWDEEISDWARDETPVFGSQEDADDASDRLQGLTRDAWYLSMLVTPSGDEFHVWARNKLQGYAVEWAATLVTSELTSGLKSWTDRERPDGSDDRSFPSGHASSAFAYGSLASRNVDQIRMPAALRWSLHAGLFTAAAGTAWARVEGGRHYPTDVLDGAALGNFVSRFVHDAFLGLPADVQLTAYADPDRGDWSLGVAFSF